MNLEELYIIPPLSQQQHTAGVDLIGRADYWALLVRTILFLFA